MHERWERKKSKSGKCGGLRNMNAWVMAHPCGGANYGCSCALLRVATEWRRTSVGLNMLVISGSG